MGFCDPKYAHAKDVSFCEWLATQLRLQPRRSGTRHLPQCQFGKESGPVLRGCNIDVESLALTSGFNSGIWIFLY